LPSLLKQRQELSFLCTPCMLEHAGHAWFVEELHDQSTKEIAHPII
jgi:hypothetical protein